MNVRWAFGVAPKLKHPVRTGYTAGIRPVESGFADGLPFPVLDPQQSSQRFTGVNFERQMPRQRRDGAGWLCRDVGYQLTTTRNEEAQSKGACAECQPRWSQCRNPRKKSQQAGIAVCKLLSAKAVRCRAGRMYGS